MSATEIATVAMKPGSDIGDPSNAAAVIFKEVCSTVQQQNGVRSIHFGTQIESPDVLQLFIDWETLDHHRKFQASEVYQPFLAKLGSVVSAMPVLHHADFTPAGALTRTLAAPVAEVVMMNFEGDGPPAGRNAGLLKFRQVIIDNKVEGFIDAVAGETLEDVEIDGTTGKGLAIILGWTSVEAHMAFRETPIFKDNVGVFRTGVQKSSMKHVALMKYVN